MSENQYAAKVVRRARDLIDQISDRKDRHGSDLAKFKLLQGPYPGVGPTLDDFSQLIWALDTACTEYEGAAKGHTHIPHTKTIVPGLGGDTDMNETHESFGLVAFDRVSYGGGSGARLFGSRLTHHPVAIRMTVRRAERTHTQDMAHTRYYGRGQLIEVELSASQFADVITLMNHGEGIPCTIKYVGGEKMEEVPEEHQSENQEIVNAFREKMKDVRASVGPELEKLESILGKGGAVNKGDRKEIAWLFEKVVRRFSSESAFQLEQFADASVKLGNEAKGDVEGYVHSLIIAAGLDKLKERIDGVIQPAALPDGGKKDGGGA